MTESVCEKRTRRREISVGGVCESRIVPGIANGSPIEDDAKNPDRILELVNVSIADSGGEQPHFHSSPTVKFDVRNKRVYFGRIDNFVYRNRDNVN